MNPLAVFAVLNALEDFVGDVTASVFEFWGACFEALATADLSDL